MIGEGRLNWRSLFHIRANAHVASWLKTDVRNDGDLVAVGWKADLTREVERSVLPLCTAELGVTGLLSPRSRWRDAGEHEVNKSAHLCGRQTSRSKPQTVFALMPFLIWSMANFGLYTFIAAILRRSLPATVVPLLLLLFGLGAVAGNFIGGVLSDRFGTRKPMITCLTLLICALGGDRVKTLRRKRTIPGRRGP